ncbi:hypothetical protein Taro_002456, partial [Colocasia esculenta]|nr:hypothetical protein [Colocasia esculenta]
YRASGQQQAEATPSETIDIEEVFEEEHPLHAWVNATSSVEPEFHPHDRAWAEGELDDVPLLLEFETPPAPKRQKKTMGARGRSKKYGISIADLETIEEDVDDETPESSHNVVYRTSNDSTSKTIYGSRVSGRKTISFNLKVAASRIRFLVGTEGWVLGVVIICTSTSDKSKLDFG